MAQSISPKDKLQGTEAVEKLKAIAEKAGTAMLTTSLQNAVPNCRPMALQAVCEQGNLWFITSSENDSTKEIAEDPKVMLHFANTGSYQFLYLIGNATIHQDKTLIEKYWTSFANAWFDGKEDPRVRILKVAPTDSYYWDTKDGKIVAFAKMSFAALTGKKMEDGGVEGILEV